MPYIPTEDRHRVVMNGPSSVGELNFAITRLLIDYVEAAGLSYTTLNDCVGACEAAKLEFYRRMVVPYEDKKIAANGDVY